MSCIKFELQNQWLKLTPSPPKAYAHAALSRDILMVLAFNRSISTEVQKRDMT
jgi:hypothetical protein